MDIASVGSKALEFIGIAQKRFFHSLYCALCCWLAVAVGVGYRSGAMPLDCVDEFLDWFGIPTAWLASPETWIDARGGTIRLVAAVAMVLLALWASSDSQSEYGRTVPTLLLAFALNSQAGGGVAVMVLIIVASLALWAFGSWATQRYQRRGHRYLPVIVFVARDRSERFIKVFLLGLMLGLLSILTWPMGDAPREDGA